MRPFGARAATATAQDLCLVCVTNKTAGPLHVLGEMRTPRGAVFLDTALYDLEQTGACVFLAAAANDLLLTLPAGARRLTLKAGELRLLPGAGTRQRLLPAAPGLPHRWTLLVDVDADLPCAEPALPPLRELLRQQLLASPPSLRALFDADDFPPQCTVLLPRGALPRPVPLGRLVIPEALFCVQRRPTEARTLDGGRVRIAPAGSTQMLFTVEEAEGEDLRAAEPLRLRAESVPLRCAERWQLVYLCA
jgi:hypothetical protein